MREPATPVLHEEDAFVVLAPRPELHEGEYVIVLPKAHISVLSELEPEEMASLLAGLSRLVLSMKRAYQVNEVTVRPNPRTLSTHGHLRFHLIPQAVPVQHGTVKASSPPKLGS